MTNEDLKKARGIIDAATPGPWKPDRDLEGIFSNYDGKCHVPVGSSDNCGCGESFVCIDEPDEIFICAARTGWPEALDEVERLRKVNEEIFAVTPSEAELYSEIAKLRAVAEAAGEFLNSDGYDNDKNRRMWVAYKIWREADAIAK